MKPQDPPTRTGHAAFETLVNDAVVGFTAYKQTAAHALALGLRPNDLIRYVRDGIEPNEIESIARSPWALGRIVALVKARRDPNSLGAKLLASTNINPYHWGMRDTGDWDTDMCLLLERV